MKKILPILLILQILAQATAFAQSSDANAMPAGEAESKHFVVKSDWKGVKCKKHYLDYGAPVQECIFPNATLQQVYNIVKRVDKNLKTELSVTNFKYSPSKKAGRGCISVDYQYKAEKHLLIELSYEGGETSIEIEENEKNTRSKITYSAD